MQTQHGGEGESGSVSLTSRRTWLGETRRSLPRCEQPAAADRALMERGDPSARDRTLIHHSPLFAVRFGYPFRISHRI